MLTIRKVEKTFVVAVTYITLLVMVHLAPSIGTSDSMKRKTSSQKAYKTGKGHIQILTLAFLVEAMQTFNNNFKSLIQLQILATVNPFTLSLSFT